MVWYAEHQFWLDGPVDKSGVSYRAHLRQVWKTDPGAGMPAELRPRPFPAAGEMVWKAFQDMNRRRTSNGFGANPITFEEIRAYCQLSGTYLRPGDIEIVTALDDEFRAALAASQKRLADEDAAAVGRGRR